MRVLVTGGDGFIGTHLRAELEANGHTTNSLDRPLDLGKVGVFPTFLDRIKPDAVVHLAAQVGRIFGEQDLLHTIESNATMTTLVAHACGEADVPVLYCSSSEIYGDWGERSLNERGPFKVPHNLYGLTKRWGEEACILYAPHRLSVVRLSMPYGPGAPPGVGRRAMDTMLWQAHHHMPITVHRGAERSWCWVGDTVRGMRLVLEATNDHDWTGRSAYNVGRDDCPLSMYQLAVEACDLADAPRDLIQLVDPPAKQTVVKRLSTDKLRDLGWQPEVELVDGLPKVYDWIKQFDPTGRAI